MKMEFDFKEISDSNSRFLKKKVGDDMIKFMKFEYEIVSKTHLTPFRLWIDTQNWNISWLLSYMAHRKLGSLKAPPPW